MDLAFGYTGEDDRPDRFRAVHSLTPLTNTIRRVSEIKPIYRSDEQITVDPNSVDRSTDNKINTARYRPATVPQILPPEAYTTLSPRSMKPRIQRKTVDLPEHSSGIGRIDIENLVDIPVEQLEALATYVGDSTKELSDIMLKDGAGMLMSFDNASAYTEAALRDGFNVDANIDSSVQYMLEQLLTLNVVSFYTKRMTSISKPMKDLFLRRFIRALVDDGAAEMKKKNLGQRYSKALKAMAGRVVENNPLGVVRSLGTKDD